MHVDDCSGLSELAGLDIEAHLHMLRHGSGCTLADQGGAHSLHPILSWAPEYSALGEILRTKYGQI